MHPHSRAWDGELFHAREGRSRSAKERAIASA
jgi:hypothetical protein